MLDSIVIMRCMKQTTMPPRSYAFTNDGRKWYIFDEYASKGFKPRKLTQIIYPFGFAEYKAIQDDYDPNYFGRWWIETAKGEQ